MKQELYMLLLHELFLQIQHCTVGMFTVISRIQTPAMASPPLMSLAIVQTWFDFFFFFFFLFVWWNKGWAFFFLLLLKGDGSLESCFPMKSHKPVTGEYWPLNLLQMCAHLIFLCSVEQCRCLNAPSKVFFHSVVFVTCEEDFILIGF